ncbi:uma2 family protein [Leptolyngbya sp. Heron Island J]|uniref:Uma2 family endonuclease n=1 Tax=Leptolyngbya sp. Heron Island J TaxID=1385935 RepID=UPI0003B992DA|nr:Uma2 family endonuclease [Leptolyngbya sp. Heron Island J]ESA37035.1 uma2 family protein [Leptolyngbya sp. Heron Island J]
MTAFTVNLESAITLTDQQFYQLCRQNPDLKFERTAEGNLVIMSPTGGETGNRNGRLTQQLFNWSDNNESGIVFDSSTGFKLPNGADRSPDAAWVALERWQALTSEQQEQFVPLCPDFVVELMSPSDALSKAQEKMAEYLDNGLRLGWLINRKGRFVEIYRPNQPVERLENPTQLSGEAVLPDFNLKLSYIW